MCRSIAGPLPTNPLPTNCPQFCLALLGTVSTSTLHLHRLTVCISSQRRGNFWDRAYGMNSTW